ncbi:MAG TPA: hypothetical protein VMW56_01090 [Candidatus Margulisiibacteriota bacterium]|nr:hypothetical protein [Candidatus Margulisiibacteriota bacterium]
MRASAGKQKRTYGTSWSRNAAAAVAALVLTSGCALLRRANAVDPSADFTAHRGYTGIVVTHLPVGQTATLVRARSAASSSRPTHEFEVDGKPVAALWITDHAHVVVRQTANATAPPVGDVLAAWKDSGINITFHSADGVTYHSSRFHRVGGPNFPSLLDREMYAIRDLPGVYRAELRDEHDAPVGWLSVRILPYQGLPRDYQGALPGRLEGPMAAGAVALLDSEIATIIELNAFPDDRMPGGLVP